MVSLDYRKICQMDLHPLRWLMRVSLKFGSHMGNGLFEGWHVEPPIATRDHQVEQIACVAEIRSQANLQISGQGG